MAVRAGKVLAVHVFRSINFCYQYQSFPPLSSGFHGIRQAAFNALLNHQAVDHYIDVMLLGFLKVYVFIQGSYHAVHANPRETFLAKLVKDGLMFPLLAPNHRGYNQYLCPFWEGHYIIRHLLNGLLTNRFPTLRAMSMAYPGKEQAQVVIDFRNRPHCRPRVARGGLLVDGNSWGQALYIVHVRLIHLAQELTSIGGQGFNIASLPFRINGIKG